MSRFVLMIRTLFSLVAVLACLSAIAQEPSASTLTWYKAFFEGTSYLADTALAQSERRLHDAREGGDAQSQAHEYKTLGLIQLTRLYNYEKALENFMKALALEDSVTTDDRAITYVAIAAVFEQVGDAAKSSEFLARALEQTLGSVDLQAYVLNKNGSMLLTQGKLDAALEHYELVLELNDASAPTATRAETLRHIARVYVEKGALDRALETYKASLELFRSARKRADEAQVLNDVANLYQRMKNTERALANHVAAIEIRQGLKDNRGLAESFNNAAVLYYQQQKLDRALANLQLALNAGNEVQATGEIRRSYEYCYLSYKALGDFEQALVYLEKYSSLTELLQNEKDSRELAAQESRFVIGNIEAKIERLELERISRERELIAQKRFRNVLILTIALVGIIAALVLVLYLSKRRTNAILKAINEKVQAQNLQLQELNATKDKFFSIISHDLKGPLNSLTSFSGLLINHTDRLSKEDIQMLATDLDKSVKNLFTLLENLLEWSRSQTGTIDFKPESFDLAEVLRENQSLLQAQAQAKGIELQLTAPGSILVQAHRNSISTVVRNLLSNAIKFTPANGQIQLVLESRNGSVMVSVKDTGVGMGPDVLAKLFRIDTKHSTKGTANEKGTGLGLILCKDFVEKNGGTMGVSSELNKGSVFHFTLPL